MTDTEINAYLILLKTEFPAISGLERTNHLDASGYIIPIQTTEWVRILYCNNNHWICSTGKLDNYDEDVCIFDSLPRNNINEHLGDQLARMIPNTINEKKKN